MKRYFSLILASAGMIAIFTPTPAMAQSVQVIVEIQSFFAWLLGGG